MRRPSQHTPKLLRRLACTSAIALAVAPAAWGAEWRITPSVSVTESFTDNSNLVPDNQDRNSELTTELTPAVSIRGQGGRVGINADYALSKLFFKNGTHADSLRHDLTSEGHVELWEQAVFLDAQASVSRQVIDSTAASSSSTTGRENNRATTVAYNIGPSFRHHFGTWLETESRITYSEVDVSSSAVSSTRTFEERFNAITGREFGRLQMGLQGINSKTMRDGNFPAIKSQTVDTTYSYAISRQVAALAGVGYEHFEDPTLLDPPIGITWNVGTALTPDPQTSLRITGGERFQARNIDVDASYFLSPRTSFFASYKQQLVTTQQLISGDLSLLAFDEFGNPINRITRQPFRVGTDDFSLQSTTVRSDRFAAGMNATRGRNSYNLQTNVEKRSTDATGIEQFVIGAGFGFSRELTPRTRGSVGLTYTNIDFGTADGRVDDRYAFNVGLSYLLFRNTSFDMNFLRTQRFSQQDANDLTENAAFVRLTRSF
jgi:uncharacterized protein (PEP-CTERM system associated)